MLHNNMDLQIGGACPQVEDSRNKGAFVMLGGLSLKIREVPTMEDTETILASVSNPSSRGGNRFLGTLTLIGVKHLKEANLSQKWSMEVRCSALRRTVLSVDEITVESADMVLMPISGLIRVGTW